MNVRELLHQVSTQTGVDEWVVTALAGAALYFLCPLAFRACKRALGFGRELPPLARRMLELMGRTSEWTYTPGNYARSVHLAHDKLHVTMPFDYTGKRNKGQVYFSCPPNEKDGIFPPEKAKRKLDKAALALYRKLAAREQEKTSAEALARLT